MSQLYPLQIIPEFVERVWGTHDVSLLYPHAVGAQPVGEVWLTADHCRVANGPLQGTMLGEVCRAYGGRLLGAAPADCHSFPLLMKVLFPREKLSVQVHPDDQMAEGNGERCGKTECWYILKAAEGAKVALGLKPGTTRRDVEEAIAEQRLEQLLNWLEVYEGEMLYVGAGTVHAIAPGAVIVETQQNSDTTYRLYDYGRPRELHIQQALAAMKPDARCGEIRSDGETLVQAPRFEVSKFVLAEARMFSTRGRGDGEAHCLVALDGAARIECAGTQPVSLSRGEAVIVPAEIGAYTVVPQWSCAILAAHTPEEVFPEPETEPLEDIVLASAKSR